MCKTPSCILVPVISEHFLEIIVHHSPEHNAQLVLAPCLFSWEKSWDRAIVLGTETKGSSSLVKYIYSSHNLSLVCTSWFHSLAVNQGKPSFQKQWERLNSVFYRLRLWIKLFVEFCAQNSVEITIASLNVIWDKKKVIKLLRNILPQGDSAILLRLPSTGLLVLRTFSKTVQRRLQRAPL